MKNKQSNINLIFTFLRGSVRYFVLSILCAIGVTLTDLLSPQIIRFTVDSVLGDEPIGLPGFAAGLVERLGGIAYLRGHLGMIALAVVAVSVFALFFQYGFQLFNSLGAESLVRSMRDRVFSHIEQLPFAWHMKQQTGDIIQRCTSDVDMIKRFVSDQLTSLFKVVLLLALSLIFMCSMNWKLSIIAMATIPIILIYSVFFRNRVEKGFTACDENEGKLSAIAQENLTGVRVVRAFGREAYERERFGVQNEHYTSLWIKLSRLFSTFWCSLDLLSGMQVMLIVTLGAYFCIQGEMTAGEYIAFISYNAMLTWPVRHLGRMISEMSKAGVSLGRIAEIMHASPEADPDGALAGEEAPLDGDIVFDHVSFGYDGCPELLHDVSFTVPAGSTLGILGGTGSGKSTLVYLLCRLYDIAPGQGRITIGGVDIAQMKAAHLRQGIGMVMQEPFLFARTLKKNIGIALEDEEEAGESIRAAARTACLDDTIASFTEGYDTLVGERGVTLSGGQKQRAAIARALVRPTPILVFDDALSAVDTETDAKIRAALAGSTTGSTRIYISHRVTTLMHCDRILVLEEGRVAQVGTHEELLRNPGLYRQIYDIQTSREDSSAKGTAGADSTAGGENC